MTHKIQMIFFKIKENSNKIWWKEEKSQSQSLLEERRENLLSIEKLACIGSKLNQCSRTDVYVLEGKKLEFYLRKIKIYKGKKILSSVVRVIKVFTVLLTKEKENNSYRKWIGLLILSFMFLTFPRFFPCVPRLFIYKHAKQFLLQSKFLLLLILLLVFIFLLFWEIYFSKVKKQESVFWPRFMAESRRRREKDRKEVVNPFLC